MGCGASRAGGTGAHSNVGKQCLGDICFVREVTDEDVHDVYDFTGPVLGSGAFATVVMVKSKMSGMEYAMKQIDISEAKDNASTMRMLENEIEGMKITNHPNIVRLQEVYRPKDEDMLYLVLDRLSGGSVESLRKQEGRIEEGHAAYVMAQVVDAVRYCHDLNIAHRDLKLSNCMFEDKSETPIVKVIDFGLCAKFKDGQTSSAFVGTRTYVAPEVIMKNKRHRLECDMWSVGVMTYALVGGSLPFYSPNHAVLEMQIKYKKQAYPDEVWKDVSENCRDFIDKCLTKNPWKRITAAQAQMHPWVQDAVEAMATEEPRLPLSKSAMLSMMRFQETTMFEKIAMELIAYSYDPSDIRDLERHFREMDTDGSGTVTLDEFKRAMKERKKAVAAQNSQRKGALQAEASADAADAAEAASVSKAKAPPLVPVREMERAVSAIGRLDDAGIESVFEAIDVDGCGCISINDFVAACLVKKQINHNHIKAAFERLDYGMKGLITPEDVSKYLGDSYAESGIAKDMREISSRDDGLVTLEDFITCMKEYILKSNVSSAASSKRSTIDSSFAREAKEEPASEEHTAVQHR